MAILITCHTQCKTSIRCIAQQRALFSVHHSLFTCHLDCPCMSPLPFPHPLTCPTAESGSYVADFHAKYLAHLHTLRHTAQANDQWMHTCEKAKKLADGMRVPAMAYDPLQSLRTDHPCSRPHRCPHQHTAMACSNGSTSKQRGEAGWHQETQMQLSSLPGASRSPS